MIAPFKKNEAKQSGEFHRIFGHLGAGLLYAFGKFAA